MSEKELVSAGEMDNQELYIKVRSAKQPAMELTFMHEIIHAVNNEMKETDVEYLAQALYQIIMDNPHVFEGGGKSGK